MGQSTHAARTRLGILADATTGSRFLASELHPTAGGTMSTEHIETVIIGAGQAGLSTAFHLKKQGRACVVLDSNSRVGDNWRRHWDTLRLYSPAKYDGLPGMPFPADPWTFPQKDEVAAFLER